MRSTAKRYDDLRVTLETIPIVDTHEHHVRREKSTDIISFVASGYLGSDFTSAVGDREMRILTDQSRSIEERYPIFNRALEATRHTGYGQMVRIGLERVFGAGPIDIARLKAMQDALPDFSSEEPFEALINDARVVARVSDKWPALHDVVAGTVLRLPGQYLAISLPSLHRLVDRGSIAQLEEAIDRTITSLDEYLDACRFLFEKWRENGAVCFKDQSAYTRGIAYEMPPRADAERLFNELLSEPRHVLSWGTEGHALSDYLFHAFLRIARDMDIPVQVHTGHMAGTYNDVAKANAKGLRSILEVHRDVRFDLFHANWPYEGDVLYLGKNYPNVSINFCWAHQVDPLYSKEMMKRCVATVPTTKVHGVGSDVSGDLPHLTYAHAVMARDGIAAALAELIDIDYLSFADAVEIAGMWMYENPREYFSLPIPPLGQGE
jgi:uncharacterized protein